MAFPSKIYTGLKQMRPVNYTDPIEGHAEHFYMVAKSPAALAPETGQIINFPVAPTGYVHILDKFKCSIDPTDAAKNQIRAEMYSIDLINLLWRFTFNLAELAGNPFYGYPLILSDYQGVLALSFVANAGLFPDEYFYFRHRFSKER